MSTIIILILLIQLLIISTKNSIINENVYLFNRDDNNNNEKNSYEFKTEQLPNNLKLMPTIGNGHISYTILSNSIYLNGLYNGKNGLSHRARIPNYSNIILTSLINNNYEQFLIKYKLNVQNGIFEIIYENNLMKIKQLIYAHRYYNRIIVNQFYVYRKQMNGKIKINIRQEFGDKTDDINFYKIDNYTIIKNSSEDNDEIPFDNDDSNEHNDDYYYQYQKLRTIRNNINRNPPPFMVHRIDIEEDPGLWLAKKQNDQILLHLMKGETKEIENEKYQKKFSQICCIWNEIPNELILNENQQFATFKYLLAIDENCLIAKQEINDVLQRTNKFLLQSHFNQWKKFWNSFSIKIDGNLELGRAIYGSLFYLASALPSLESNQANTKYYGLSPTGLGRGGNNLDDYQGHNFWDTEIWMLPVITHIEPNWSRQLLNYRFRMLEIAKDNAKRSGYNGARFPWESAYTGVETTNPCCPYVALMQYHITADISYALQQYFSNTYDSEWLHNEGCPLAQNIAEFWASRVVESSLSSPKHYDIKFVMGPDEDHTNVTNNVFTNVVASYALRFGDFARSICSYQMTQSESSSKWIEIADNLKILYDSVNDYHPQYEGYTMDTIIKQADAVLLGYPLMFPMNDSTRKNDLRIYEEVTRKTGPAMTWAMHAINHLDVGEFNKAEELFNRSYQNYIRSPFQVFSEVISDDNGAVNFLTGAGGFLQSIINGYAGVRIFLDRMEIRQPHVTPATAKLSISGIKYLGSTFDIIVRSENESTIQCTSLNPTHPLILHDDDKKFQIRKNFIYNILSRSIAIKPIRNNFKDWR